MFNNKTIFISGGTGSFGNKFLEKISKLCRPKKVIIYSRDEYKHFKMQQIFTPNKFPFVRFFLGDVRDLNRLNLAMKNVDYVVHAAALKQVPIAEYNPIEFVKTNVGGSENIIQASINQKVKKIIALSTDKAANPINLYGATKLCADKLFVSANSLVGKQNTIFSVVRYGNVLGSRGSVIPYFKNLIGKGENTLPITDKEMTRFWITLDQALDFVFFGFKIMTGGEILVPKLPSVRIVDLAKSFKENIKIKYIGVRPGEKIHELMCPNEFHHQTLEFKKYFIILPKLDKKIIKKIEKKTGQKSKRVQKNFEYSSGNNSQFLKIQDIKKLNKKNNF